MMMITQNREFIMENPIKMDDLWVPHGTGNLQYSNSRDSWGAGAGVKARPCGRCVSTCLDALWTLGVPQVLVSKKENEGGCLRKSPQP